MEITADWIKGKLIGYGVPAGDARILAAVAYGESGYNPAAELITSDEHSTGLFQINTFAHSDKLERWTGSNSPDVWHDYLTNPEKNVFAASEVYKSQGLGAWTVYTSGGYRQYLDSSDAVRYVGGDSGQGAPISAHGVDWPGSVAGIIRNPLVWILLFVVLIIRR